MNIKNFRDGDIVTRIETTHKGDRSYLGDKLIFVGVKKGIILLIQQNNVSFETLTLETDWWSDGWDYYPDELRKQAISKLKSLLLGKDIIKINIEAK